MIEYKFYFLCTYTQSLKILTSLNKLIKVEKVIWVFVKFMQYLRDFICVQFKFAGKLVCWWDEQILFPFFLQGDYEMVISDYARAKSLFAETDIKTFKKGGHMDFSCRIP